MTTPQRLERDLPTILGELALAPYPEYIDDVLVTTAQRRQRPPWTFPERWLPMELTTQRVQGPSMPWRALGALALVALLVASAVAIYVGTRPRLPDPFGPAVNGLVSYESGGTVYLFDPATDTTRTIEVGADGWIDPWFSPDGRLMLLARARPSNEAEFGVLSVDGGVVRPITPEPLSTADWIEWSPRSDALITVPLVKHAKGKINVLEPGVVILDVENGTATEVPTPPHPLYATYLPPDGERILVVTGEGSHSTFWTMRPDGSDPTEILRTGSGATVVGRPSASPDGELLAYAVWRPAEERVVVEIRDMTSGEDRRIADDPAIDYTGWPRFSPDGRTLYVERREDRGGPAEDVHLAFIDVASGIVQPTDLAVPDGVAAEWTPDGSALIASVRDADGTMAPHVLVDHPSGVVTPAPWSAVSYPSMQRLAP